MKNTVLVAVVLGGLGALGWWQSASLLGRYYLHQLACVDQTNQEAWVNRLAALDVAVQGPTLELLRDERLCLAGERVLAGMMRNWPADDPRRLHLADELAQRFASLSEPGKLAAAAVAATLTTECTGDFDPAILSCSAGMLQQGAHDLGARPQLLQLAWELAKRTSVDGELLAALADEGLEHATAKVRALAAHLFLQGPLSSSEHQYRLVPLLRDPSSEVRRAALLVLGTNTEVVGEDDLLPLLHDEDADVVDLCEQTLRSRGLQAEHMLLARLISDPRPSARLEVVQYLDRASDLDPGVWLRRLAQDISPAVRAAAVRAAVSQRQTDMRDHLLDMAHSDPSPTVRQLANHYLRRGRDR